MTRAALLGLGRDRRGRSGLRAADAVGRLRADIALRGDPRVRSRSPVHRPLRERDLRPRARRTGTTTRRKARRSTSGGAVVPAAARRRRRAGEPRTTARAIRQRWPACRCGRSGRSASGRSCCPALGLLAAPAPDGRAARAGARRRGRRSSGSARSCCRSRRCSSRTCPAAALAFLSFCSPVPRDGGAACASPPRAQPQGSRSRPTCRSPFRPCCSGSTPRHARRTYGGSLAFGGGRPRRAAAAAPRSTSWAFGNPFHLPYAGVALNPGAGGSSSARQSRVLQPVHCRASASPSSSCSSQRGLLVLTPVVAAGVAGCRAALAARPPLGGRR